MKKGIIITLIALLIIASPAVAAPPPHSNANSNSNKENPGKVKSKEVKNENSNRADSEEENNVDSNNTEDENISITPSPTETEDDLEEEESEGDVQGVQASVQDEECDPNAEWKNHGQYVSCVAHLHLGGEVVSEAARSDIGKKNKIEPSVSPSPTASPSPSISPTSPITSAIATLDDGISPLDTLSELLANVYDFVKSLF